MPSSKRAPEADDRLAIQEFFALLGERWNLPILREIFFGTTRFGALQRALAIPPTTLTNRLAELLDRGLLERERYREDKDWYDYRLSTAARDVVPAWIAMAQWAQLHLRLGPAETRVLRHRTCGAITEAVPTCAHCGEPLHGRDIDPVDLSDMP